MLTANPTPEYGAKGQVQNVNIRSKDKSKGIQTV